MGGSNTDSGFEPFVWDKINGIRSLSEVLINDLNIDLTGWSLGSATAVSDNGLVLVGFGTNPEGDTEAWTATIPEPTSLTLLATSLFALLSRKRK